jgi:small subunit ribosomal protein S5
MKIVNETIPHRVVKKFKSSTVMLKPAPKGSGIIAGGAVRVMLDMAGIPNVSSKILGKTKNKIVTAKATFEALKAFKGAQKAVVHEEEIKKEEIVEKEKVMTKLKPKAKTA